jgi:hypothetical protein
MASSAAIATRFRGDKRVSGRFLIGELTPSTAASLSSDEWRFDVDSKARATGMAAALDAAGVLGSVAAFWRATMASWVKRGEEGGVDMVMFFVKRDGGDERLGGLEVRDPPKIWSQELRGVEV